MMTFGIRYLLLFLLYGCFFSVLEVSTENDFTNTIESFNFKCLDNSVKKNQKYRVGLQVTKSVSHQLLSRIFAIFLQEVLHFEDVNLISLQNIVAKDNGEWAKFYETLDNLRNINIFNDINNHDMMNIEVWTPNPKYGPMQDLICDNGPSITPGRFGWFVPQDFLTVKERNAGLSYNIFMDKSNEAYKRYVLSSDILRKLKNDTVLKEFSHPDCASHNCVTFLAEFPHDTAFIQDDIESLGVYVNVLWLGSNFKSHIDWLYSFYRNNSLNQNQSFVVLHWKPSYVIDSNIKFKQILLPRCEETKVFEKSNCKYELKTISKYSFCNKKSSRAISALRNFYIKDAELNELFLKFDAMQKTYKNTTSEQELYNNVACSWLKKNKKTYENWVPIQTKIRLSIGGIFPIKDASRGHQNLLNAVNLAVSAINKNSSILTNYDLIVLKNDGQCKADAVMRTVIHYFNTGVNMLGILGPACSETVEPIAGVSRHLNMPVISYSAEGASFMDRQTYPYFFRTIGSNRQYEDVFISLMQKFGWKRVAAITEDGQKHTEYISHMEETMKNKKLSLILNKKFSSDVTATEMNKHLRELKEKRAKIIIADIHYRMAEVALCEAHKLEMTATNGYVWFLPSWLAKNWNFNNSNKSCSNEDLKEFLKGHLSIMHKSYGDGKSIMQENISIDDWLLSYKNGKDNISDYTGFVYDAVWVYAKAADKLIRENDEAINNLRSVLVVERLKDLIWQTDFQGLSGRVRFGEGGSRITDLVIMQWIDYNFIEVGKYEPQINTRGNIIYRLNGQLTFTKDIQWLSNQDPPDDGTYDCKFSALAKLLSIDCDHSTLSFSIILCLIGVLIVSIISFLFWKKRYDNKLKKSAKIMKNFGIDLLSPTQNTFKTLDKWEVPKKNVVVNRRLGQGAFGTVYGGEVMLKPGKWTAVAIKTLKPGTSIEDRLDFLSEAEAMKSFDHKNIIKFLGVCLQSDPIYTIMEFMLYGDLKTYLLARRHLVNNNIHDDSDVSSKHLTMYAIDIARGLSYLEKQKYVHRDIACRNCLVDANRVVKIGDFGMARPTYQSGYYVLHRKGMLPVRWMAPESLFHGKFTPASDVWAFGVTIYEILTFGSIPYADLTDHRVVEDIRSGKTLKIPSGAKIQLENLIKDCWNEDPKKRPTAMEILEIFFNHPRLLTPCLENPSTSVKISETDPEGIELLPIPRNNFNFLINPNFNAITENNRITQDATNSRNNQNNNPSENLYVEAEPVTPNGYSIMSPLLRTQINVNSNSSQARLLH